MVCVICVYIMAHLFKPEAKKFGSSMQLFTQRSKFTVTWENKPKLFKNGKFDETHNRY